MAIELNKTGYCKYCPHFEPETFSEEITSNDTGYRVLKTNVKCEHEEACKRMDSMLNSMLMDINADLLKKTYKNFETIDHNRFVVECMIKESFESVLTTICE
ncbi:MAG: hypothetical protein J6Y02_01305 [Pseudobutyrivibrio sp.]|nr:hypothetical protein [Pseudobutyrivibrio sp.]